LCGQSRESRRWIVHATALFCFAGQRRGEIPGLADTSGTQVTETPDKATQAQPGTAQPAPSNRLPAIMVSLAALAVVGAATANALPNFHFALPSFNRPSLPNFSGVSLPSISGISLPDFSGFSLPDFSRFAAPPPHETASVRTPDPIISAALLDIQLSQKDVQSSEQQNGAVLASLTQSAANQQADLKRISRQLSSLATQLDALQSAVAPLTTSSIPHPKPRARVALTSRKMPPPLPPPLPKPVGPVSVGGAPLSPAPAPGSG
jgi:hypothetical protein